MPTIRKIGVLVSIFFLYRFPVMAETAQGLYSFSLSPLIGMISGKSEEILYKNKDTDQYVSQLLWDLKPLFYVGLKADLSPRDPFREGGFILAAQFKFGLPQKSGIMEDKDWADMYADYLTHYSQHNAYSQTAVLSDISAGYSWLIKDFLVLSIYGEFSYMYYSWMAEDGFYQYSKKLSEGHFEEWDESIPKEQVYGAVIRYSQNWFIFSPALSVKGKIGGRFFLEGNISYSPLVYCEDRDDHLLQGRLFFAYFSPGHYINGGANFNLSVLETLNISLSVSYRYITGLRDKSYYSATGTGVSGYSVENYNGGVGYSALDLSFAVRIRVYGRH